MKHVKTIHTLTISTTVYAQTVISVFLTCSPSKPREQLQAYVSTPSIHVPCPLQVTPMQSSIFILQCHGTSESRYTLCAAWSLKVLFSDGQVHCYVHIPPSVIFSWRWNPHSLGMIYQHLVH